MSEYNWLGEKEFTDAVESAMNTTPLPKHMQTQLLLFAALGTYLGAAQGAGSREAWLGACATVFDANAMGIA